MPPGTIGADVQCGANGMTSAKRYAGSGNTSPIQRVYAGRTESARGGYYCGLGSFSGKAGLRRR